MDFFHTMQQHLIRQLATVLDFPGSKRNKTGHLTFMSVALPTQLGLTMYGNDST